MRNTSFRINSDEPKLTFEQFVKQSRVAALKQITARIRGNHALAEDLLVEAYLKMHRTWGEQERKYSRTCYSLLWRAVGWVTSDHYRKPQPSSLEALLEEGVPEPLTSIDGQRNIIEVIHLQQVLKGLGEDDLALLMLDAEGYTVKQIAQARERTVPAVKSRLHRIKKLLRQQYEGAASVVPIAAPSAQKLLSIQQAATLIDRELYWVLVRIKLLGSEHLIEIRNNQGPSVYLTDNVVRKLREISRRERFVATSALTRNEVANLMAQPEEGSYVTSKQICRLLDRSEYWVRIRLAPHIASAVFLRNKQNGGTWLHFPWSIYCKLKREVDEAKDADGWMTAGGMSDVLRRHPKWVTRRLIRVSKELRVHSEERILPDGRKRTCWPPAVLDALRAEATKVPDRNTWVSIAYLSRVSGKDWQWVKHQLNELGAEPATLRIPGSGKTFPHYPPEVEAEILARAKTIVRAPPGWLTANGLELATQKSANWVRRQLTLQKTAEAAEYADEHMVPRTHYGPSVVNALLASASKKDALAEKGDYLSVSEIATAIGKSQGWTRKHLGLIQARGSQRRNQQGHVGTYYSRCILNRLLDYSS